MRRKIPEQKAKRLAWCQNHRRESAANFFTESTESAAVNFFTGSSMKQLAPIIEKDTPTVLQDIHIRLSNLEINLETNESRNRRWVTATKCALTEMELLED